MLGTLIDCPTNTSTPRPGCITTTSGITIPHSADMCNPIPSDWRGDQPHEYALNNPIRIYDPFGLEPNQTCVAACTVGGGIIGGGLSYVGGGLLGGTGGTLVAPGVGTIGGAIGGADLGGAAGTVAGSAAGNAAGQALCPDDDDEDKCEKQAQEDEQMCRMATMPGMPARARCWASVQERYGACRAGRPLPPLVI